MSACGYSAAAEEEGGGPATVESIEDSDLSKVVLQASAAKRIGLETAHGRASARSTAPWSSPERSSAATVEAASRCA